MLIAACAIMALAACSDDDSTSVTNPKMQFCAVGDTTTAVSQLTFTKWSSFQMIDIQSNIDWQLSCDADWVTLSNHSGVPTSGASKTLHLKVTVPENMTGQQRTATITLTGGGQMARLAVVQNSIYVDPLGWISAEDAGNAMKIGLNLYNTMEAYGTWFDWTPSVFEAYYHDLDQLQEIARCEFSDFEEDYPKFHKVRFSFEKIETV